MIDWPLIQPFSTPGEAIGLTHQRSDLPQLRPSDLAGLLEDLATPKCQELLATLDPHLAADAVEDMHEDDVADLFRNVPVKDAVRLLEHMDADEAADALRDLDQDRQEELLDALTWTGILELDRVTPDRGTPAISTIITTPGHGAGPGRAPRSAGPPRPEPWRVTWPLESCHG